MCHHANRVASQLARLGDALWGSGDAPEHRPHFPLWPYLGVASVAFLLLVGRRIDGLTNPQFWAEDGTVFFQQNLEVGCWRALHTLFRGFPYLGQRLVACAVTPLPFVAVPMAYNLVAYVVAAAAIAAFSVPGFRHVIRSDALRVVLCLALAGLPQATRLLGSLTDTSWFLGMWLILLTAMRLPASSRASAALAGAGLLATYSTPLSVVTVPLWLARSVHALRYRQMRDVAFALVLSSGVGILFLVSPQLGSDTRTPEHLARPILDSMMMLVLADAAIGTRATVALLGRSGPGALYVLALTMLGLVIGLAWWARWRSVPVLLYCAYAAALSAVLPLLARPPLAGAASNMGVTLPRFHETFGRYHMVAVGLVYLAVLASVDRLHGRGRRLAIGAVIAWLVSVQVPTFIAPPLHDLRWPLQAARLERKVSEKDPEPLTIPVNPDPSGLWFHIEVDHRVLGAEIRVPREQVLGSLSDASFEQSFVSRCANLSEIQLLLGKQGSATTQTVYVELRDDTSGRTVETFTLDGSAVVDGASETERVAFIERRAAEQGWPISHEVARALGSVDYLTPLYFSPLPDSLGKRYVIRISASGGTPHDSVIVYGSARDAYGDGEARRDGRSLAGDVVFGYGCSPGASAGRD